VQRGLADLYGLVAFVGARPFTERVWWRIVLEVSIRSTTSKEVRICSTDLCILVSVTSNQFCMPVVTVLWPYGRSAPKEVRPSPGIVYASRPVSDFMAISLMIAYTVVCTCIDGITLSL
jgi:hypothetical protein